jgi:hypothetical protein
MNFKFKRKTIIKQVWAVVALFVILSMVLFQVALPFLK